MGTILIKGAKLLDIVKGTYRENAFVAIEKDRIVEVGEKGAAFKADRVIDARGFTLMPGLIDLHVHAYLTSMDLASISRKPMSLLLMEAAQMASAMLDRGFTTVRDMAGADHGFATAIERDVIRGPRMFVSGRALSQTGGHGDQRPRGEQIEICACGANTTWLSQVVDGVPAVLAATRVELRGGAHQIKLMASGGIASPADPLMSVQFTIEEIKAITGEAVDWGTYAAAHAYSPPAIQRAVEGGVRTIEHGNLLDAPTAELMAQRGVFLVPTLVTYQTLRDLGREAGLPEVSIRKTGAVLEAGLQSLEIAQAAGVEMGFGTDLLGIAQPQQNREFEIRRQVLPAIDVIRSATTTAAKILQHEGEIGVIAPGAYADMILVDGDPLRDIGVLAKPETSIRLVMKAGKVYRDSL
jgi:imidazolonepropionase-like amidohydrolase